MQVSTEPLRVSISDSLDVRCLLKVLEYLLIFMSCGLILAINVCFCSPSTTVKARCKT